MHLKSAYFCALMKSARSHYKVNLQLAVPVMIGQLGHIMVGVADSVMVGQLGTLPLAAVALGNSLFSIFMVFGIGIAYGITPLVANADGRGGRHLQSIVLHHGFWLNLVISVLLFLLIVAMGPVLRYLDQDPKVVDLALPYLNIISASIIPLLIFMSFKQFAEGLSDTRMAMIASVACNLINVGLNFLLIYGYWGFPELGINGAGWGTLISRILMMVVMAWYVLRHRKFARFRLGLFHTNIRRKVIKRLLGLGIPTGLQYIFEVGAFAMAAIFAGMISAVALAAHHIAINIASVSYMTVSGLGAAAGVRVGNQRGRRDPANLKMACKTIFIMTISWMAFAGLVILLFNKTLVGFYSEDTAVIAIAVNMLIVVVLFQLSDGLQAVGLGALRGFQDVKIPTTITFMVYWPITLPAAYYLSQHTALGVMGIWYALAVGLTLSAVLILFRLHRLVNEFARKWSG